MRKNRTFRLATIRLLMVAIVCCAISLATVSCTSLEDNPSGQTGPVKPEEGFFTSEINALIDANYPQGELLVEAYR